MGKRALIFGVSGQDGALLSRHLLDRGYVVYGTSRDARANSFANLVKLGCLDKVSLLTASLLSPSDVEKSVQTAQPDEIYNLSGQSSVGLSYQDPAGTMDSHYQANINVIYSIMRYDKSIRYYNACSGECFGDTGESGADESTPFMPRSPYGEAKSAAYWNTYNAREAHGLFACSGILFNHESSLRGDNFVTQKVVTAARRIASGSNECLELGDLTISRDWGWAPDYVDAMWMMLQEDSPEDYVIASGKANTLEYFVDIAFSYFGLNWKNHVQISQQYMRPNEIKKSFGRPKKANDQLGWKSKYDLEQILSRMIEEKY